jgi:hypothetical protein
MDKEYLQEIGVSGVKIQSGQVYEEFLRELQGDKGRRTYREMADNSAIIGAILRAIELIILSAEWMTIPAEESEAADEWAKWLEDALFHDMSHTWGDFVSDALSMLVYGWSYFEVVYKLRKAEDSPRAELRSRYPDGRVGIRKIAPRAQTTLERWELDENGGVSGFHQWDSYSGRRAYIPIEKSLHFRVRRAGGNPDGTSILRNSYVSYYYIKMIQNAEAVGIERELAGFPVFRIPSKYLVSTDAEDVAIKNAYERTVRDIKLNDQGGLVIPSDTWINADGSKTNIPLVDFSLVSSSGSRSIETRPVILGYQQDIARTVLADFLMLGASDRGSYAQHRSSADLFTQSCEALLDRIKDVVDRYLVTRLWDHPANKFPRELMPSLATTPLAKVDLEALGIFIQRLAASGAPLFPDNSLERYLREIAGLPYASAEK